MKTMGDDNPYALPPALLQEVEAAADAEHRPVADVVRDALELYLTNRHPGRVTPSASVPARRSPADAAARLRALRRDTALPDGVTMRDMMTHGRA